MNPVPLALDAEKLQDIAVGNQQFGEAYRNRLRQDIRIVHGRLDVQMPEVTPMETLPDVHRLAARMSVGIQPALVVESRRIHHQRVAFPLTSRVSHPCRKRIDRKFASIGVDLAKDSISLVKHRNLFARLKDLKGKTDSINSRQTHRQAVGLRTIHRLPALQSKGHGLRSKRSLSRLEVDQHVEKVSGEAARIVPRDHRGAEITEEPFDLTGRRRLDLPDSGKIRLTIPAAWRLSRQVRLPVPRPRSSRIWIVQPLGIRRYDRTCQRDPQTQCVKAHILHNPTSKVDVSEDNRGIVPIRLARLWIAAQESRQRPAVS